MLVEASANGGVASSIEREVLEDKSDLAGKASAQGLEVGRCAAAMRAFEIAELDDDDWLSGEPSIHRNGSLSSDCADE